MLRRTIFGNVFKPKNLHSLEHLRYLYNVLSKNTTVSEGNRSLLVETLRSIAEILIWGDQNDSSVFDFFLEKNMLSFFLRIMKQKCGSYVCVQALQTLNILFENIRNETSLYYLFSNNHVNSIIVHKFDFSDEEVMAYYISFLKTLSFKLNSHTIHFFYNEHTNDFPLYTEAIKFFNHPESMVRIAVRTLTLNVYRVNDQSMLRFIKDRTAVPYFSNLVWFIGSHILEIDACIRDDIGHDSRDRLSGLVAEHLDHLYYLNDILSHNITPLNNLLSHHLLKRLFVPLIVHSLLPLSAIRERSLPNSSDEDDINTSRGASTPRISRVVSLFLLAQVFLILSFPPLVETLARTLLYGGDKILKFYTPSHGSPYSSSVFVPPSESLEKSLINSGVSTPQKRYPQHQDSTDSDKTVTEELLPEEDDREGSVSSSLNITDEEKEQLLGTYQLPESSTLFEDISPNSRPFLHSVLEALNCSDSDYSALFALCLLFALGENAGLNDKLLKNHMGKNVQNSNSNAGFSSDGESNGSDNFPKDKFAEGLAAISTTMKTLAFTEIAVKNKDASTELENLGNTDLTNLNKNAVEASEDDITTPHTSTQCSSSDGNDQGDPTTEFLKEALTAHTKANLDHDGPIPILAGTYNHLLVGKLLQVISMASRQNSSVRVVTLEVAVQLLHVLVGTSTSTEAASSTFDTPVKLDSASSKPSYSKASSNSAQETSQSIQIPATQQACASTLQNTELESSPLRRGKLRHISGNKAALTDSHLAILEGAREEATLVLRNYYKSEEMFLDLFEDEWKQQSSKPVKVEYLLQDSTLLLPPTSTPLTGIHLSKRRPCGEVERARRAIRVFLLARSACIAMRGETDTQLPLTNPSSCVSVDDLLDLNNIDLISCQVTMREGGERSRRFLAIDLIQFILVEPDSKRLGWGVAKFVGFLQDLEVSGDQNDSRALHLTLHRPSVHHPRSKPPAPLLAGKFVFEDHIRCMAAKQRLNKGRTKARQRKLFAISSLLELPGDLTPCPSPPPSSTLHAMRREANQRRTNHSRTRHVRPPSSQAPLSAGTSRRVSRVDGGGASVEVGGVSGKEGVIRVGEEIPLEPMSRRNKIANPSHAVLKRS